MTEIATRIRPERLRAITWAAAFAADPRAAVLDVETTGVEDDAEIVDIAIVAMYGTILANLLVKPDHPIPVQASAVHGITDDVVALAQSWPVVWPIVANLVTRLHIAAWNAPFDWARVNHACRSHRFEEITRRWDDPMQQYGAFEGTLGKYGGFRWWKLDAACQHLGITPAGHRALADAEATRQVILAMAAAAD